MSRRFSPWSGRAAAVVAVAGAISLAASGTASAATIAYKAGGGVGGTGVTYTCTFPAISPQPVQIAAQFNAPDSVPSGTVVTPSSIAGTATISASVHNLLTAAGYDGIRGKANVPITATGGTLSSSTVTNLNIPQTIYPSGGTVTVNIAQDSGTGVPKLTAGAKGKATVSLGGTLNAPLEFHKKSSNTWTAYTMNCTLKSTSPAQNTAFSPSLTIT